MFCNSTAETTKKTYYSSTNNFKHFIMSCAVLPCIRWVSKQLSVNALIFCFYTAYLSPPRVPFDSLIFYYDVVLGMKIIFLFCGCWCWCGWSTFFVFKSLDNNMVYSLCIDVYLYERNRCTTKVLWVLKFWEVGGRDFFFQNHSR